MENHCNIVFHQNIGYDEVVIQLPNVAQIQLLQPSQIQLHGGQTLQLQGQQGQTQQFIIQQPQTAVTAGQNQVTSFCHVFVEI